MDHDKPRQKNSPLDYFYPRFGWLQTSSKLGSFLFESIINIRKSIAFAMLFWWAGMDHDKPRQKNSPLDYFYPRFGWLQTSSKLGSFLFESIINIRKSIAFAMLFWWAGMDSNHRTRMRTDFLLL